MRELLGKQGGGLANNCQPLSLIQIGGPLGQLHSGSVLDTPIAELLDQRDAPMVSFFGSRFCAVDFARFLTRFLVRELRIDTPHVRRFNRTLETIASPEGSATDLETLHSLCRTAPADLCRAERQLNHLIETLLERFALQFQRHAQEQRCEQSICRSLFIKNAPCANTCPAHMNIPGYIELIKKERWADAYKLMKQENPLSFICGKICSAPCESRCRQGDINNRPLAIRQLKRFAAEQALNGNAAETDRMTANGKQVAVVGGGPAGISAAIYLARSGYSVTLHEARTKLGGMLAWGIPSYRLPEESLDSELAQLNELGVKIKVGCKVGKDLTLAELRQNFDAVLLASGRWIGRRFGPPSEQIDSALTFLSRIRSGEQENLSGKTVVVIGGGAVAMDATQSAIRLGAKVIQASLEPRDLMPAPAREVEEAEAEGMTLLDGWSIKEYHQNSERLNGLTLQRCIQVFDNENRFAPKFDDNQLKKLDADHVVLAIGQDAELDFLDSDINLDERNQLDLDADGQTSAAGVFAVGDIIAPGLVINAIANGKRVAATIDKHLSGTGLYTGCTIGVPESKQSCTIWDLPRAEPSIMPASERCNNFTEYEATLSLAKAKQEADRCLRCDRNSSQPLHLRQFES